MRWGDSKRDLDPILAVWPSYEPLSGVWQMIELAESKPGIAKWRTRRIEGPTGGVRLDRYLEEDAAIAAAEIANRDCAVSLDRRPLSDEARRSLRLKAMKGLQAKVRLKSEETFMLSEAKRRKQNVLAPAPADLKLASTAERYRDELAKALAEFPYVTGIRVGELRDRTAMVRDYEGTWSIWTRSLSERGAVLIERSKIACGFDLNPTDHWGEMKAKIRQMLLPRANQLLQLASVRRLLDEALAKGQKVLVGAGVVFWYEEDGQVGWQVKLTDGSEATDGNALWTEGTIHSKNHGRLVILPYIKENGDHVRGHTKNAAKDGPAKPRHPSQFVDIPFQLLDGDLMIGLFGELPYE